MREGFYSITYAGKAGDWGFGMIAFDTGRVIGADAAGGLYDGTYSYNKRSDQIDSDLTLTVPPGVPLVTGMPPSDKEYKLPFKASIPRETAGTPVTIDIGVGKVNVLIKYIRDFPE